MHILVSAQHANSKPASSCRTMQCQYCPPLNQLPPPARLLFPQLFPQPASLPTAPTYSWLLFPQLSFPASFSFPSSHPSWLLFPQLGSSPPSSHPLPPLPPAPSPSALPSCSFSMPQLKLVPVWGQIARHNSVYMWVSIPPISPSPAKTMIWIAFQRPTLKHLSAAGPQLPTQHQGTGHLRQHRTLW